MRRLIKEWLRRKIAESLAPQHFTPIAESSPGDVFVAGYPKSGNTWVQSMLASIQFGIDPVYLTDRLALEIVPDVHMAKFYKRFGSMMFFKTHDLPKPEHRKVIYLVRDGRDAMVSYYAMNRNFGIEVTLDQMVLEGRHVFPCRWHEHVAAWRENAHHAEVMTLRYEDLIADPMPCMRSVCRFAGLERNDEVLRTAVQGCGFDRMKRRAADYPRLGHAEWEGRGPQNFFRQGKTGSYREEMPAGLVREFEALSRRELESFGYPTGA